jgi:hypothetical protein
VPFLLDAGTFAAAAALVAAMDGRFRVERPTGAAPTTLRSEIAEGVRWLVRHRLLRILAVAIALMNLTLSATCPSRSCTPRSAWVSARSATAC